MDHGAFHIPALRPPRAGAPSCFHRHSLSSPAWPPRPFVLKSLRALAAWVMLLVMLANFAAEGAVLFHAPLAPVREPILEFFTGLFSPPPAAPLSCCAATPEPQKSACGCTCCGDVCPMGDACSCSGEGRDTLPLDGLFFQMPRCHSDAGHAAAHVPLSLRMMFVIQLAVTGEIRFSRPAPPESPHKPLISWIHPPPDPPPRSA